MTNVEGHCHCGAVEITLKEYGSFVYSCHCSDCRRLNSGPVLSVDPGTGANVIFAKGKDRITIYHDGEIERGFCSVCGSTLFWHNPADDHHCMSAELFDAVVASADFQLELFYDHKPAYYAFAGERKKLDSSFKEISSTNHKTKGDTTMNMTNMIFCQSCGMPLEAEESYGTNADGSKNKDFCVYCYKDGAYTNPNCTMEEMMDICAPHMPMPEAEARKQMLAFFPTLKRWQQ
jgi:hypothetical protein